MSLQVTRGQMVRIRTADGTGTHQPFRNASGTPTDPTTVTLRVTLPDATTTDYTLAGTQVIKDTTVYANGDFYYDLATAAFNDAQCGRLVFAWLGTGTVVAADFGTIDVVNEKTGR